MFHYANNRDRFQKSKGDARSIVEFVGIKRQVGMSSC